MVISVEFDGTIVENKYPDLGKEIPGAIYILKELQNRGNKIILCTQRQGDKLKAATDFCEKQSLTFDGTNANPFDEGSNKNPPPGKIVRADVYIDARNAGKKPDWIKIFWELHPDEYNYVKLKKPVKKRKFLKRIFRR